MTTNGDMRKAKHDDRSGKTFNWEASNKVVLNCGSCQFYFF